MTKVFVYGTLRKGHGNHGLLEQSKFIGDAKTDKKYAMYASGIPYVTSLEHEVQIIGEVYEVDDFGLHRLDRLEGHPNFYERRKIKVILENGRKEKAFLYFYDQVSDEKRKFTLDKILNGDYINQELGENENVSKEDYIWWTDRG